MTGIATNLNLANGVLIACLSATIPSNAASYFDEYRSMFTVIISGITCAGFIFSVAWASWIRHQTLKELKKDKAKKPSSPESE